MGIASVSLTKLRLQDTSSEYRREVDALGSAFSEWGFAYLVDLDQPHILTQMLQAAAAFFSLPLEEKMLLAPRRFRPESSNRYRGYFPLSRGSHSLKEGFELGWKDYRVTGSSYVFDEPSVWPASEPMDGWRALTERYFSYQLDIGRTLLVAFEIFFELPSGYFTSKFENTLSTLRLLHYPVRDSSTDDGELERDGSTVFSTPAHTDSGILTLLLQDDTGGLQVLRASSHWEDVQPIENSIVMNIGDLLELWTDGVFKATQHRLKAPSGSRYSVPFFFEPEGAALIESFKPPTFRLSYESYLYEKVATFIEYQDV